MGSSATKGVAAAIAAVVVCGLIGFSAQHTVRMSEGITAGMPVLTTSQNSTLTPTEGIHTPTQEELKAAFTISADTLSAYAGVNEAQCTMPIREVAVDIQGLNAGHTYKTEPELQDKQLGAQGVLVVRPYSGPWNWMSYETIETIDQVLDAVYDKYDLPADTPLVLFGRSMGGVGALNYAHYGKHPVSAVAVNCPVTNLSYHCTERPDCAATIYRAYNYYDCSVEEAVAQHDPMQFIDELPKVPYFFVAGDADVSVNKGVHSDVYVPLMREKGYDVTYLEVPGMAHVDLLKHPEALKQYSDFIASFAK